VADAEVGDPIVSPAETLPQVAVLLATYNGARFLPQQIDSILAQDYPAIDIVAGDDGSTDGTLGILQEYAARLSGRLTLLPAERPSGSARANFARLMQAATAEYVCFADQDDVWLPGKVSRSLAAMQHLERRHGAGMPLLVFSDLRVVDAELKMLAPSMWRQMDIDPESVHRLERLVGRSVVTGCTMLINRRMLELARRMPAEATMHDRWIGLLAAAMGAAASIPEPTVLYRQHGANVIGAAAADDSVSGIARRAADSNPRRAERIRCEKMAEALLRLHEAEMPQASASLLRAYLRSGRSESAVERVWLTLRHGFDRGGVLKTVATILDLARARSDAPGAEKIRCGS
jgi:glycosyltransferase involved in cell wall biosynthesis